MTTWERFWYVLQNIWFGAGYFSKLPSAKALDEVDGSHLIRGWAKFWYYALNIITFASLYFFKVPVKRALEQRGAQLIRP